MKGQLKQAGRIGARSVAIVGEDGTTVALKDMESGEQDEIELQRVIPLVLRKGKTLA